MQPLVFVLQAVWDSVIKEYCWYFNETQRTECLKIACLLCAAMGSSPLKLTRPTLNQQHSHLALGIEGVRLSWATGLTVMSGTARASQQHRLPTAQQQGCWLDALLWEQPPGIHLGSSRGKQAIQELISLSHPDNILASSLGWKRHGIAK